MSKRCLSHFSWTGPLGTLASAREMSNPDSAQRVGASGASVMWRLLGRGHRWPPPESDRLARVAAGSEPSRDHPKENGERDEGEPARDDDGEGDGKPANAAVPPGLVDAERLKDAPGAVVQVHAETE